MLTSPKDQTDVYIDEDDARDNIRAGLCSHDDTVEFMVKDTTNVGGTYYASLSKEKAFNFALELLRLSRS